MHSLNLILSLLIDQNQIRNYNYYLILKILFLIYLNFAVEKKIDY
jgi:hypothetical protein